MRVPPEDITAYVFAAVFIVVVTPLLIFKKSVPAITITAIAAAVTFGVIACTSNDPPVVIVKRVVGSPHAGPLRTNNNSSKKTPVKNNSIQLPDKQAEMKVDMQAEMQAKMQADMRAGFHEMKAQMQKELLDREAFEQKVHDQNESNFHQEPPSNHQGAMSNQQGQFHPQNEAINYNALRAELSKYPPPSSGGERDMFDFDHPGVRIEVERSGKASKLRERKSLQLARAATDMTKSLTAEGREVLNIAKEVTPPFQSTFEYVSDVNPENVGNIRQHGLYGVKGDITADVMRRGAVANNRLVQPIGARYEFAKYLAYDMPHRRDTFMVPKRGDKTAVTDSKLYK